MLVATREQNGERGSDLFDCVPGELVWIPPQCGRRGCTCGEDFAGGASKGWTSTALVTSLPVEREVAIDTLAGAMCSHCYAGARARTEAERLLRTAARLPMGAVVERAHGGGIVVRTGAR